LTKKGQALRLHPEKKQWPVVSGQRLEVRGRGKGHLARNSPWLCKAE
jgi:hypothetical protein